MTDEILHWKGVAIALALAGCAAPAPEPAQPSRPPPAAPALQVEAPEDRDPASLIGTRWVLVEAGGRPVPPRPPATLNFEAARFGGHGGCNGYGGEYLIEGRRIVVGLVGSTLIGCSGPVGAVEDALFRGIGGAFEIAHRLGQSLTIL
ncbi:MAG TPA: META domain-containing protein, partial [Allosphingosinicella sp.]